MNQELTINIIKHIFSNLLIIPTDFIDPNQSQSLISKDFQLEDFLIFEDGQNKEIKNKIWGCQISVEQQEFKMLLGDCTQENDFVEYCLIVQFKNFPAYGLYLVYNSQQYDEALIACSLNKKDWMPCNTYLQATFLAGMEQMKELGLAWNKCTNYKEQYELMLSFIKFHHSFFEGNDAD